MHPVRQLAFTASAVGSIALLAGCGAITKAATTATPPASVASAAAAICAADPSLCAASPTDTPASAATPDNLTGPVGTAYTDTDASGNVMAVTLTGITDPARGANFLHNSEQRLSFRGREILDHRRVGGQFASNTNSDASVIGGDGQTYSADFSNVRGCTNFSYGQYTVTASRTSVGCVVFQVPNEVKVASVQWGGAYGSTPALWTI